MHKMKKYLVFMLTLLLLFSSLLVPVGAAPALDIAATAAILVDATSGKIFYAANIDEKLPPASMSKMMTEYLVQQAISNGDISWDDQVNISDYAFKISQNRSLSNVYLRVDESYSVQELYEAVAIYSANGATIALAEHVSGSEKEFVEQMNRTAKTLGMTNSSFVNASGLNNDSLQGFFHTGAEEDENIMSARDCALLAYHLINDYPAALTVSSIAKKVFKEGTKDAIAMSNWNFMLPSLVYGYDGMDGLKTGYTSSAGNCFTGTAKRSDLRLISVVMGCTSQKARFQETAKLMDYGFANLEMQKVAASGYVLPGSEALPVKTGKEKVVPVALASDISTVTLKGSAKPVLSYTEEAELVAPVAAGTEAATAKLVYTDGQEFLNDELRAKESAKVVTTAEVKKANIFVRFWRFVLGLFV